MCLDEKRHEQLSAFQERIGYHFDNVNWLNEALTHSSKRTEGPNGMQWNERLEFLGDAALNFVVTDYLFNKYDRAQEGTLTELRKSMVDESALCDVGKRMGIREVLDIGNSPRMGGGVSNFMVGDATEAILGAIYRDGGGVDAVRQFIHRWFVNGVR